MLSMQYTLLAALLSLHPPRWSSLPGWGTGSSKNAFLAQALQCTVATFTQFLASWLFVVKYWEMSRFYSYKCFGLIYQMFCQLMLHSNKKDGRLIVLRKRRSRFRNILHRSKLASCCSLYSCTHCTLYYIPLCIVYSVQTQLYPNIQCRLYIVHYTLCVVYNAHTT